MRDTTPFQRWFEQLLEERGWGVREAARQLGLTVSTASLYKAGKMLPDVERQRRLAEATAMAVERLARLVWESQDARRAIREAPPVAVAARTTFQSRRRWRYRFRPLGIAFTMYRTRAVQEDSLARLHALATERRRSIESTLPAGTRARSGRVAPDPLLADRDDHGRWIRDEGPESPAQPFDHDLGDELLAGVIHERRPNLHRRVLG